MQKSSGNVPQYPQPMSAIGRAAGAVRGAMQPGSMGPGLMTPQPQPAQTPNPIAFRGPDAAAQFPPTMGPRLAAMMRRG